MTLYRLYTERRDNLATLASRYFDGFTLIPAEGYWQGEGEFSTIIEVITDDDAYSRVICLARDILATNGQQSVYITRQLVVLTKVTP